MPTRDPFSSAYQVISGIGELTGDPTMPTQQVALLLALASTTGSMSQASLEAVTKVGRSSVARHITSLGAGDPLKGVKGLGLVDQYEDPKDRRSKLVRLTPTGRALMDQLAAKVK